MLMFWWRVFLEALEHSLQTIGKEPSDILVSIFVFLIIGLYLVYRKGWPKGWEEVKERTPRVLGEDFAIVLCVFIFILGFHMARDSYREWRDAEDRTRQIEQEKKSLASELEQERDKTKPKLSGRFEQWIFTTINKQTEKTYIFLQVVVKNTGAPSILERWGFTITMKDGNVYEGRGRFFPNVRSFRPNPKITLYAEDNLYVKDVNEPIPTGGKRTGWLLFEVLKPEKDLFYPDAIMDLSFEDVQGTEYHTKQTVRGSGSEQPMFYPGFKIPQKR
jgi:hypothetical protein